MLKTKEADESESHAIIKLIEVKIQYIYIYIWVVTAHIGGSSNHYITLAARSSHLPCTLRVGNISKIRETPSKATTKEWSSRSSHLQY